MMPKFEVKNELENGFTVICNTTSVVSGIPSKELADQVLDELKSLDSVDWDTFPHDMYMSESLVIGEVIEKIRLKNKE